MPDVVPAGGGGVGVASAAASSLSGRWHPDGTALTTVSSVASKAQLKSWPPLALAMLQIDTTTLETIETPREIMEIRHAEERVTVQHHFRPMRAPAASSAPLTLQLDDRPHEFHTGASVLTITASQLGESECFDLLIKIDFPPLVREGDSGVVTVSGVRKFVDFSAEQIARHRAGFILERSHASSADTLMQVIEYHAAPASMKDEAVAQLDSQHLPVVYAITRTYSRSGSKKRTTVVEQEASRYASESAAARSVSDNSHVRGNASLVVPSPTLVSASAPTTPAVQALASPLGISAASSPSPSPSASSSSSPPYCTLSGTWKVDKTRGDTLDGLMKELGVAWLARKVVLALDVTTRIEHDPRAHTCTVTDLSSAGEQATTHQTNGEWNEVRTKEGKTIRMCAREGEEMRSIWSDLPASVQAAPLPFPSATEGGGVQVEFPSHLPVPLSPSQKLHPLPYGYLWIHSHLPDLPGGEMQDVRVLLDRTTMVQQTMILKNRKCTHTTTRYFIRQETPDERNTAELEWEARVNAWTRRQDEAIPDEKDDDDEDADADEQAQADADSEEASRLLPSPISLPSTPSPSLPVTGPQPDMSGVWVVDKARSNDLSALLKRMGVPWIYRAFASALDVRTIISQTERDISITDASKFGRHAQVLQIEGAPWNCVVQYGNKSRVGLCRVTTDASKQSVTLETVYLTPTGAATASSVAATPRSGTTTPSTPSSGFRDVSRSPSLVRTSTPIVGGVGMEVVREKQRSLGGGSGELLVTSSEPESLLPPPLLTMESSGSPSLAPRRNSDRVTTDDSISMHDESLATDDPLDHDAEEARDALLPLPAASHSPSRRALPNGAGAVGDVSLESSFEDLSRASTDDSSLPSSPAVAPRAAMSVLVGSGSGASTPALGSPAFAAPSPASSAIFATSTAAAAAGTAPPLSRSASAASFAPGGHIVSSRVVDIRVLVAPGLMRQVITYLEYDTVVCVCSRHLRREPTKAERDAERDEKKRRKKAEEEERDKEKEREKQKKAAEAEAKKRAANDNTATQMTQSTTTTTGQQDASSGSTSNATSSAAAPSSHRRASMKLAPVSVVLPSAIAAAAASSSSASESLVHLSSVTPLRASVAFLLVVALASGSLALQAIVVASVAAAVYHELVVRGGVAAPVAAGRATLASPTRASNGRSHFTGPTIPLGGGLTVEVVPLRH